MFEELCAQVSSEFPSFRIARKQDSHLMRAIAVLLAVVTLGRMRKFMTSYTTTLGCTVYVSSGWDASDEVSKCVLLRHERVHMRQSKRLGRLLYSFLYLVPFFPLGFAYWRTKLEKEAYEESMRATVQMRGTSVVFSPAYKEWMVGQFCGPAYGWMWAFGRESVGEWFDKTLDSVVREYVGKPPRPPASARRL